MVTVTDPESSSSVTPAATMSGDIVPFRFSSAPHVQPLRMVRYSQPSSSSSTRGYGSKNSPSHGFSSWTETPWHGFDSWNAAPSYGFVSQNGPHPGLHSRIPSQHSVRISSQQGTLCMSVPARQTEPPNLEPETSRRKQTSRRRARGGWPESDGVPPPVTRRRKISTESCSRTTGGGRGPPSPPSTHRRRLWSGGSDSDDGVGRNSAQGGSRTTRFGGGRGSPSPPSTHKRAWSSGSDSDERVTRRTQRGSRTTRSPFSGSDSRRPAGGGRGPPSPPSIPRRRYPLSPSPPLRDNSPPPPPPPSGRRNPSGRRQPRHLSPITSTGEVMTAMAHQFPVADNYKWIELRGGRDRKKTSERTIYQCSRHNCGARKTITVAYSGKHRQDEEDGDEDLDF